MEPAWILIRHVQRGTLSRCACYERGPGEKREQFRCDCKVTNSDLKSGLADRRKHPFAPFRLPNLRVRLGTFRVAGRDQAFSTASWRTPKTKLPLPTWTIPSYPAGSLHQRTSSVLCGSGDPKTSLQDGPAFTARKQRGSTTCHTSPLLIHKNGTIHN